MATVDALAALTLFGRDTEESAEFAVARAKGVVHVDIADEFRRQAELFDADQGAAVVVGEDLLRSGNFTGRDSSPNDWCLYPTDYPSITTKLLRSRKPLGVTYNLVPDTNVAGVTHLHGEMVDYWAIWKSPTAP